MLVCKDYRMQYLIICQILIYFNTLSDSSLPFSHTNVFIRANEIFVPLPFFTLIKTSCNMNAFFSLIFLWFIPEYKQQLRTIKIIYRYKILHTLFLACSFITLREPCNNQRPRCDIARLHVTNHLYHGF